MTEKSHIVWHEHSVQRARGCVLWFTGLSGSGKSTVANCVDQRLHDLGLPGFVLDGDNIRHGLNASPEILADEFGETYGKRFGLGFSAEDRQENIRRIGAVAEIFCSAGLLTITAFVSPYRADRDRVRQYVESRGNAGDFVEIFVDTPLEVCEARDPKGLYKKARAGEIKGFTGIDDPYEEPVNPELVLDGTEPVELLADQVLAFLRAIGKVPAE
ncbi:MAG: adenylyl-sulfate kinase [Pirellulaceae bacterium]